MILNPFSSPSSAHHEKEIKDLTLINDQYTAKLRGEVEFLQGAFESYKSQLHADTDIKWRKHENQIKQVRNFKGLNLNSVILLSIQELILSIGLYLNHFVEGKVLQRI